VSSASTRGGSANGGEPGGSQQRAGGGSQDIEARKISRLASGGVVVSRVAFTVRAAQAMGTPLMVECGGNGGGAFGEVDGEVWGGPPAFARTAALPTQADRSADLGCDTGADMPITAGVGTHSDSDLDPDTA